MVGQNWLIHQNKFYLGWKICQILIFICFNEYSDTTYKNYYLMIKEIFTTIFGKIALYTKFYDPCKTKLHK
jgi:hypothetical protein